MRQERLGLMRRIDVSPDPVVMLDTALKEAAKAGGIDFTVEDGAIFPTLSFEPQRCSLRRKTTLTRFP